MPGAERFPCSVEFADRPQPGPLQVSVATKLKKLLHWRERAGVRLELGSWVIRTVGFAVAKPFRTLGLPRKLVLIARSH